MGCGVEANYCNRINRWFVGIFVNDRAQTTDIAAGRWICQIRHIEEMETTVRQFSSRALYLWRNQHLPLCPFIMQ